jgi:hypothetical protein
MPHWSFSRSSLEAEHAAHPPAKCGSSTERKRPDLPLRLRVSPMCGSDGICWSGRAGQDGGGVESATVVARTGRALLSVYRRPDGYYVVRHALTTSHLWVLEGSPPVVVSLDATPEALGDALREAAALDAHRVPHPSREEFTRDGNQRSAALFAGAGVRSWRSFERG